MQKYVGVKVSEGIVVGNALHYKAPHLKQCQVSAKTPEQILKLFAEAQQRAISELDTVIAKAKKEAGDEIASLFEMHQLLVEDPDFVELVQNKIQEGVDLYDAILEGGKEMSEILAQMDDAYLKNRAADIVDVATRIANNLSEEKAENVITEPVVLLASDLSPSQTMQLDHSKILAIALSHGSQNGHTSILARTLGIPCVILLGDKIAEIQDGTNVIVDGEDGLVITEPLAEVAEAYEGKINSRQKRLAMLDSARGKTFVDKSGHNIKVYCNIGSPADVASVIRNDGEGIGLYRSEFLYLGQNSFPDEETQFAAYKTVLAAMPDKEVIIRTSDIGSDKKLPYFELPAEENPALGLRAVRVALAKSEMFKTQLRALYRASAFGKLSIMFPMIASVWELKACRALCEEVKNELKQENIPFAENVKLGIMIETPAAAITSELLAPYADFFSCGTNDLTQYTLACDRQNSGMKNYFDYGHPAVLKLLEIAAENAHKHNIPIGICGESASNQELLPFYAKIRIDELSVSPAKVLATRAKLLELGIEERHCRAFSEPSKNPGDE